MLETIKSSLKNLPTISFEEYFQQYVMDVQDTTINDEITTFVRNNPLDVMLIAAVIKDSYERLIDHGTK